MSIRSRCSCFQVASFSALLVAGSLSLLLTTGCDHPATATSSSAALGSSPAPSAIASSSAAPACKPSFDDCATPADEDCDGKTPPCDGAERWAHRLAGGGDERVTSIVHARDGSHWVAGIFQGELRLSDAISLKADDRPTQPVEHTAFEDHDSFIGRFDDDGKATQVIQIGGIGDQSSSEMAADADENLYLVGTFTKGLSIGGAPMTEGKQFLNRVGYVASVDAKGKARWYESTGGFDYAASYESVAVSGPGVWVSGYRESTAVEIAPIVRRLGLGGEKGFEWTPSNQFERLWFSSLVADPAGGVIVLGIYRGHLQPGGKDALPFIDASGRETGFAVALDDQGNVRWAKSIGVGLYPQHGAIDPSGRMAITGTLGAYAAAGGHDYKKGDGFVIGLDAQHEERFFKQFTGRTMGDRSTSVYWKAQQYFTEAWANGTLVDTDPAGNVLVLGGFSKTFSWEGAETKSDHLRDAILFKLAPDGHELWHTLISGPAQLPHALAVDAHGEAWVGGIHVDKADGLLARHVP